MTNYDADDVTRAYVAATMWTAIALTSDGDMATLDEVVPGLTPDDLPSDILDAMRETVAGFLAYIDEDGINTSAWTAEGLGHDLALTREGHGAGFWDRGRGDAGDALTRAAKTFRGEGLIAYVDDDGATTYDYD